MTLYSSSSDSTEEPEIREAKRETRRLKRLDQELEWRQRLCAKHDNALVRELGEQLQPETQREQAEQLILTVYGKSSAEIYNGWLQRIRPHFNAAPVDDLVVRTAFKDPETGKDHEVLESEFEHCIERPEEKFNRQMFGFNYFDGTSGLLDMKSKEKVSREGEKQGLFWYYGDNGW